MPHSMQMAEPGRVERKSANTSTVSARARARARVGDGNQMPWPADKVERWPIDRLIPYAKNARTHTDAQVAANTSTVSFLKTDFTNLRLRPPDFSWSTGIPKGRGPAQS